MKTNLLFVAALFCLLPNNLNAQPWNYIGKIEVGKRPVCVFYQDDVSYRNGIFVVCAGYDANQDGIMDSGDEPASLWYIQYDVEMITTFVIDTNGFKFKKPYKLIDIDFRTEILPFRPAMYKNKMYLSGHNGLYEITFTRVENDSVIAEKSQILDLKPAAISHGFSKVNSERLYLSMRPNATENGSVIVYDLDSKQFIDTIAAYPNVQMTIPLDYRDLLILSEGVSGMNNSRLQNVHIGGNLGPNKHYILSDTAIGSSANHISVFELNENHRNGITCFDSKELKFSMSDIYYHFNTLDNEGPRESIYYNGYIYTTAYNGYVYMNLYPNLSIDSLKAYGKAEGMAVNRYVLTIATPYIEKSNEPENTVKIYVTYPASVDDLSDVSYLQIFPNPAWDNISLKTNFTNGFVEIISATGIKVYESQIVNNIDLSGFAAGVYFLKIQSGNTFRIGKFSVVR